MGVKMAAMILAGGKGTRLKQLTRKAAKPAVSFGGKYRIIDFPLSNCANSGIHHVGVLTQYESSVLATYIGSGKNWGLNGINTFTSVLSPKETEEGSSWYKGTADAIYQNIDWLDEIQPEFVLILSGDHIYATTYDQMLERHISAGADCTISVLEVPWEEASRFGILEADENNIVTAFKEKPKNPKSNLASMGIYIFTYKALRSALITDAKMEDSDHDFGKNIIPMLMANKKKVVVYRYQGYWKDVGTIASLHEANMDLLLSEKSDFNMLSLSKGHPIYSEDTSSFPQYIGKNAQVKDCIINQGAVVLGTVERCVLSGDTRVEEGAACYNSVLMPGAVVKRGAVVYDAMIGPNTVIEEGRVVNEERSGIVLIA